MKENFNMEVDCDSYIVALTGASGAIYGFSILKALISRSFFVHLIISKPGFKVIKDELGMFADIEASAGGNDSSSGFNLKIKNEIENKFGLHKDGGRFAFLDENFLEARIASGSAKKR